MSDESVAVNTEDVFDAVGDMRSAFYWDDVRTTIEPPDLGAQSPTDTLWRLANLVRMSGGFSFPLTPFEPFEAGRSAGKVGVGATPGADISVAWLRPIDLEFAGWSDG